MKYTCNTYGLDETTKPMSLKDSIKFGLCILLIPTTTAIIVASIGLLLLKIF